MVCPSLSMGNLKSKNHKQITGPLLFGFIFSVVTVLMFIFVFPRDKTEKEDFYPDLTSRSAIACSEVNNFVNELDPFYNWALRSSLPSIVQMNIDRTDPDPHYLQLANSAYQQASAWRVVSNLKDEDNNQSTKVYVSSEPHLKGGRIKQQKSNWVWRLQMDWGISMRVCLSNGLSRSNTSCAWTTPVVATSPGVLGLLFTSIPYRVPTPRKEGPRYKYGDGLYLTNYASSARANFTKHQQLDKSGYYLTHDIPDCPQSRPFYYSLDAFSYLAFPALQCGCSSNGRVCVIATQNVDSASWGLFNNTKACASLKTYWAWNTGNSTHLVYAAYNSSANTNKLFPVWVPISNHSGAVSSIMPASLKVMEEVTVCVENLFQNPDSVPYKEQVIDKCSLAAGKNITAASDSDLQGMLRAIWRPTVQREAGGSGSCLRNLDLGQLTYKDNTCISKLDASTYSALNDTIGALTNVADVRLKVSKEWKRGKDNRHAVYVGVLTGLLTFLGAAFTAVSRTLQDAEEGIIKWARAPTNRSCNLPWLRASLKSLEGYWIKFLYRAFVLVLLPAGVLLYTVYSSMDGVKKERDLMQAQTVSQTLSDGTVVLVTTTATFLVDPMWTTFYVFTAVTLLLVIGALVWVGHVAERLEQEESTKVPSPAEVTA